MRNMMNEEKVKFDEVVKKVGEKLGKGVEEVGKVLEEMGKLYMDEEEEDGYVWVVESNDCLLDSEVVEEYEEKLIEVCDELGIEFVC